AILELAARRPEHAANGIRSEDRRARRDRLDTLGDDQGLAVQAALVVHDFAGVETDTELQGDLGEAAVQAGDAALDLLRAGDGATRRLEGHHEPVTRGRDHHSALLLDLHLG